jgi:ribose 5-phosphate isomerase A
VKLLVRLKMLTGVVEVGLFCDVAKAAYFGNQVGVSSYLDFLY